MVLIRKRPDISAEQFRDYYETVHAPLVDQLLPFYSAYRRNYVDHPVRKSGQDPICDVITELEFRDEAAYAAWKDALQRPEVRSQLGNDEANFLQPGETRMWRVTERASQYDM